MDRLRDRIVLLLNEDDPAEYDSSETGLTAHDIEHIAEIISCMMEAQ